MISFKMVTNQQPICQICSPKSWHLEIHTTVQSYMHQWLQARDTPGQAGLLTVQVCPTGAHGLPQLFVWFPRNYLLYTVLGISGAYLALRVALDSFSSCSTTTSALTQLTQDWPFWANTCQTRIEDQYPQHCRFCIPSSVQWWMQSCTKGPKSNQCSINLFDSELSQLGFQLLVQWMVCDSCPQLYLSNKANRLVNIISGQIIVCFVTDSIYLFIQSCLIRR